MASNSNGKLSSAGHAGGKSSEALIVLERSFDDHPGKALANPLVENNHVEQMEQ